MQSSLQFTVTETGEPHAERRILIARRHPEILKLFGYDPKTAWITLGLVITQFGIAWAFENYTDPKHLPGWIALVGFSYSFGSVLSHWLGMTIHETAHNLALKTADQNRWLALFANLPMVLPIAMSFHRYHLEHHTYLGVEDGDADLPVPFELRWIGRSAVRKFLWLFFYIFVYTVRGAHYARRPTRWEVFNWALQIGVNLLIYRYLGSTALIYLSLSTVFGHSLHPVAAHFIHEHYTFEPGQETYSYYGPLNWVTFNVGYHNEHHDFMGVPGSKLPQLRKIAAEHYTPLTSHRSWTYVLWKFITSPHLGAPSRIVRSREAFKRGQRELRKLRMQPV